ncbi:hypothetical protein A6D98_09765 [Aliivibrio fischeri]|uniref:hypothetical protein n=1 Tax=Aliivibrio fischeri TaxID=668 RepID=UPI00080DA95F|nr:hypothetical protein [Aliivibrio fischeri]OCH60877.1 hypothetical protein A6D98_09765 [Aliivibrio fischeri]
MADSSDERKRKAARERKRLSRANAAERRNSLGLSRVEIELPKAVNDQLEFLRHARGISGEAYTPSEYIKDLILNDAKQYQSQIAALGCCGKCKSPLPDGCEGTFQGDSECWRTRQSKELLL